MVAQFNFSGVTLAFPRKGKGDPYHILKEANASLKVEKGQVLGLLGESGSGKSSLLKLLAGELSSNKGSLEPDGVNEHDIILLPQGGVILEHLSIRENLQLFSKLSATKSRYKKDKLDRAIEILGISEIEQDKEKRVDQLSGGERQRVSLARVLSIDPKIVLLDEPCAAIGGIQRQQFLTLLKRSCIEAGYGAIIASHDWRDHQLVASDIVFVRQTRGEGLSSLQAMPISEFELRPQHMESIPYTTYDPVNWLLARRANGDTFDALLGEQKLCQITLPGLGGEDLVRVACGPFEYGNTKNVVDNDRLLRIGHSGCYEFFQIEQELVICKPSRGRSTKELSLPSALTVFSIEDGRMLSKL
ncbi:MAG: ABC transporter ATP-binding protein [Henriciella sp.]|nr:ABC transporter ATP-binding protein [Henriciella sp.]